MGVPGLDRMLEGTMADPMPTEAADWFNTIHERSAITRVLRLASDVGIDETDHGTLFILNGFDLTCDVDSVTLTDGWRIWVRGAGSLIAAVGDTVDGGPSIVFGADDSAMIVCDGVDALEVLQGGGSGGGSGGSEGQEGASAFLLYQFDSGTADADPGDGELRLNHATIASATAVYIDNLSESGANVSAWIDSFDNGGASANRGFLQIVERGSPQNFAIFTVTGSVVDGTGYRKLTVTHVASGGSFLAGDDIAVAFIPAGTTGLQGDPGDMSASIYDPTGVEDDAFDMANMIEAANAKVLTAAERAKIAHLSVTQAVDLDAVETAALGSLDAATYGPLISLALLSQCQVVLTGGNLRLDRYNGKYIFINGVFREIPSSGPTLAATGLTGGNYNIYAFWNGSAVALEASDTARATDSTYGHQIKSGDATRTLVAKARSTAAAWADSETQRFLINWFNRRDKTLKNAFTTTRTSVSASLAEIDTEIRVEGLSWGEDAVAAHANGYCFANGVGNYCITGLSLGGAAPQVASSVFGAAGGSCAVSDWLSPAEGNFYVTIFGAVSGGTGAWAAASTGPQVTISGRLKG